MTHPPLQGIKLILLIIGIGLGTFMEVLDITITNVSIPIITGELDVSPFNGAWIISSYAIGNGITLLLAGWLAKLIGEVKLFVISIIGFIIASFLCGIAQDFPFLIALRVIQGLLAGPLIPLSQSLLLNNFPEDKKPIALTAWSLINIVAPLLGPILGGYIADNLGWRWIFFINIPIGIVASFVTWNLLSKRETQIIKMPIDIIGILLLVIGISTLQITLDKGNDLGWFQSNVIWSLVGITIIASCYFFIWTWHSKAPIVDLKLFKKRNFAVISVCAFLSFVCIYGGLITYPLWLETQMNYSAIWAGLALMPFAVIIILVAPLSPFLIKKNVDLRLLLTISCVFFMISFFWGSQYNTNASFESLLPPRIIMGLALSFFFIPGIMIATSGIETERLANATSLFSFQRILGIGMGSSIGIAIFQARGKVHYDTLLGSVSNQNPATHHYLQKLHTLGMDGASQMIEVQSEVQSQAYMLALNDFFFFGLFIFLILGILIWFAKPPFSKSTAGAH